MRIAMCLGAAVTVAAILGCAPASAQVDSSLYSPILAPELSAPTYFEGLYAGVIWGTSGADHKNFYPTGAPDRYGFGAALGWHTYLAPGVVVGGEVQGHVDTDFAGAWGVSVLALGHLGLTTADDFLVYTVAGGGVFDSVPALAFGAGLEWGVFNALSLRYELLAFIQAAEANGQPVLPGVTAWMLRTSALWHFGEGAQDIPGFHFSFERPADITDFDGFYYGAYFAGHLNPTWNFFPDEGYGWHMTRGDQGGIVGYNYRLLDGFVIAGLEGQGGVIFDTSGDVSYNVFGLAKLGVVPFDGLFVYGAGGLGVVQGKAAYALGGGVEYALWGDASARAEILTYGEASSTPVVSGFSSTKFTMGAIWHPE
jgi:hypothetical protein